MKLLKVIFLITLILNAHTLTRFEKIQLLKTLDKLSVRQDPKKVENSKFALETAAAVVALACAIYQVAVFLFGYRKTVVFHDIPMERGFDEFDSKAIVHFAANIPKSKLEKVKKVYKSVLDIKENDKENNEMIEHMFEFIEFEDMNGWGKQDILYKVKSDNSRVSYGSILARHDTSQNGNDLFHFFLVTTQAKFKLAPKLQMKVTTSGFGVVSNKVESEIVEIPSSITPEDVQSVFYFYNFICLKQMANYFGQKFEYPKIKLNDKSKKKGKDDDDDDYDDDDE